MSKDMSWDHLLKKLASDFRTCSNCGCLSGQKHIVCYTCEQILREFMFDSDQILRTQYLVPTYSLLDWPIGEKHIVHNLVSSLKGGGFTEQAEYFMDFLLQRRIERGDFIKNQGCVILSAPARPQNLHDHAWVLASALSRLTGIPHYAGFVRKTQKSQKRLRKKERYRISLDLSPELRKILQKKQQIIFVDDVITSGATAASAYKALGQPKNFEVWTLAHRSLLAGS